MAVAGQARGRRVARKCEGCGVVFHPRVADVRRGWGRFHSKRCKAIKQEQRTGQFAEYIRQRATADEDPGDSMYWDHKE